ncbi:MAG: YegS/Rv2252/BmrU family lipid kinase [Thainema sp.]
MQRSAFLIFNPVAGAGDNHQKELDTIQSILGSDIKLEVRLTTPERGAAELTKDAIAQGAEMVIASGGDGTLSAAAAELIHTDIPLGVIARGTANAFATALGIPTDIQGACDLILNGHTQKIDVARWQDRSIILIAGIGFEAEMVEHADRELKNRFGNLAYIWSGLKELVNLHPFSAKIRTEAETIEAEVIAITVANIAPPLSILAQGPAGIIGDDGLLDVTYITHDGVSGAIAATSNLLQSAIRGVEASQEHVHYLRSKHVRIEAHPAQRVALDGEVVGETPLDIECIPQALTVVVPQAEQAEVNQASQKEVDSADKLIEEMEESTYFTMGGG